MDFCTLVGIVNEPNTPSGGAATIWSIRQNVRLALDDQILDVGCNTGFATVEFAKLFPGRVLGVDVNERSLEFARRKAREMEVPNAEFGYADALALRFPPESFAMVYCNNVTSFIRDRETAVREYYRVLKPGAYLAAVPIYYQRPPPAPLLTAVEEAIGAPLSVRGKRDWYELFHNPSAALFFDRDYEYEPQTATRIEEYTHQVMAQSFLEEFPDDSREALAERLAYFYRLFDENLRYARFCILIYRKAAPVAGTDRLKNEPILFRVREVEGQGA